MKRFLIFALFSAAALNLTFPSRSAANEDFRPERCKEEIAEACFGLTLGSGLGPCIKKHRSRFSKECRELAKHVVPSVCLKDARSLCPGIKPNDPQFPACFRENFGHTSQTCRESLKTWYWVSPDWKDKAQSACTDDQDKCPGVSHGFGKWWTCLVENSTELSASCQGFMVQDRETDVQSN